jgi:hypothetical protein
MPVLRRLRVRGLSGLRWARLYRDEEKLMLGFDKVPGVSLLLAAIFFLFALTARD